MNDIAPRSSRFGSRLRTVLRRAICLIFLSVPLHAQSTTSTEDTLDIGQFTVRAGDVLRIRVWPDSALGGNFAVEETGLVYLPILGPVQAAGRSLGDLRQALRDGYRETIRTPIVTITPVFRVSVLGAVERPGLYQLDPTQSLFDAISLAGGFRREAKDDQLQLIRNGNVIEINATRAADTGEATLAMSLRSGDRILVPRRRTFLTVQNLNLVLQSVFFIVTVIELSTR